MKYLTHPLFVNSPEWRAIRHAAMLNDCLETRIVSNERIIPASDLLDAVPVGSIEFCRSIADAQGLTMPSPIDYPVPLNPYLGRDVRMGILAESSGFFTKPVQTKAFEAFLAPISPEEFRRSLSIRNLDPNTPCWISEPVLFVHEWRVYVEHHRILGVAQYDMGEIDADMSAPELNLVLEMIGAWVDAPDAFAIDSGRTNCGKLLLVEVNDGWGTGYYPRGSLRPTEYARWCATRWMELVSHCVKKGAL